MVPFQGRLELNFSGVFFLQPWAHAFLEVLIGWEPQMDLTQSRSQVVGREGFAPSLTGNHSLDILPQRLNRETEIGPRKKKKRFLYLEIISLGC